MALAAGRARVLVHLGCAALVAAPVLFAAPPARAQWGDTYEQPQGGYAVPRRRYRDSYYRDDGSYARPSRRYQPPQQEAPRQFYWPWEERPQQAQPQPDPT
ncbi:hypothetical protein ABS774_28495, partial [Methylobacterium oxalidis]